MIQAIDSPVFYREFGALVRRRRDTLGQTQLQLASKIGLTRASIANIETGRQKVLFHQLVLIASALQLEVKDLLPTECLATPRGEFEIDIPVSGDLSDRQRRQIRQLLQGSYRAPKRAGAKE